MMLFCVATLLPQIVRSIVHTAATPGSSAGTDKLVGCEWESGVSGKKT